MGANYRSAATRAARALALRRAGLDADAIACLRRREGVATLDRCMKLDSGPIRVDLATGLGGIP
jgi:hypothetical protein